jgi:hypothetical protein
MKFRNVLSRLKLTKCQMSYFATFILFQIENKFLKDPNKLI